MKPIRLGAAGVALVTVLSGSFIATGASAQSVLDKVIKDKKVVIGTRESTVPYAYIDSKGKWTGWSVDMSRALVDVISKKVGVKLTAELKPVTPQTRISLVVNGALDWNFGATGQTIKREEVIDFSHVVNAVCVKKLTAKDSGIKTTADLAGKRVGVTKASVEERLITSMNASSKFSPPVKLISFDKHTSGFLGLQQGKTDAHVTLDDALLSLKRKAPNPDKWEVTGPDLFCINQGIILRHNDSKWRDMVNQAFCYMVVTGKYDEIYNAWFQGDKPKAGYLRNQSASLKGVIRGQCPYKSEAFLK